MTSLPSNIIDAAAEALRDEVKPAGGGVRQELGLVTSQLELGFAP